LLAYGVLAHHVPTATRLFALGAGILLLFFGVAANASRVVRPLASVLGWPATRIGGAAGTLARDNTMRNPKRTASTASALMIGLALVTFVAILGQGIRSSFESAVDGVVKLPKGGSPFGTVTISDSLFDANYVNPENEMALFNVKGGVTEANTKALESAISGFPDAKVQTQSQFKANFEKPLNDIL